MNSISDSDKFRMILFKSVGDCYHINGMLIKKESFEKVVFKQLSIASDNKVLYLMFNKSKDFSIDRIDMKRFAGVVENIRIESYGICADLLVSNNKIGCILNEKLKRYINNREELSVFLHNHLNFRRSFVSCVFPFITPKYEVVETDEILVTSVHIMTV